MTKLVAIFQHVRSMAVASGADYRYSEVPPIDPVNPPSPFDVVPAREVRREIIELARYRYTKDSSERQPAEERRFFVLDDDWLEEAWLALRKERDKLQSEKARLMGELRAISAFGFRKRLRFLFTGKIPQKRPKKG